MKLICMILLLSMKIWADDTWTIDLQQIPLRFLLQSIADIKGQNIAIGQSVEGKLDLHLEDVNGSQLWRFLIDSQHLSIQDVSGILWIDKAYTYLPLDKNQASLPQIKILAKELQFVEVKKIASLLQDKNNSMLSPLAKVMVEERVNTLWIADLSENIEMIELLLQKMDKPIGQIEIQARIVNMNAQVAQDLGVRLGFTQGGLLSGQLAGLQTDAAQTEHLSVNLPALPMDLSPISLAMNLAQFGQQHIDAELSALEGQGKAEIIASPRLLTANQEESSIATGEDIPYQESSLNGATSVAFKKALLRLKVKPYLLAHHRMILDIEINQDADSGRRVQGVPVISTKTIKTRVVVQSGQTIVLGGIQKEDEHREDVGLPVLKDIPLIGRAFSRKQTRKLREELVLFLTPNLL